MNPIENLYDALAAIHRLEEFLGGEFPLGFCGDNEDALTWCRSLELALLKQTRTRDQIVAKKLAEEHR